MAFSVRIGDSKAPMAALAAKIRDDQEIIKTLPSAFFITAYVVTAQLFCGTAHIPDTHGSGAGAVL